MPRRRNRRRLPNVLYAHEADQLIATATAAAAAPSPAGTKTKAPAKLHAARRDLVMVQAGLFLGLRVSELCKLRLCDVDIAAAAVMVRDGKGGKDRGLPLPARLVEVLREWIGERKMGDGGGEWVFPGPRGRRLSPRTVQRRLLALGVRAEIGKRLKPHTLRHSFATRLLERGANIVDVQELMGHESLETTRVYLHVTPERLKGVVDRL